MRRPVTICALLFAAFIFPLHTGRSQVPDTVVVTADSLAPVGPDVFGAAGVSDSGKAAERGSRSPGLAAALSAVVPGAGQFYNESYWKIPVVLGLGGYFTSQWLHYNRLTSEARDRYAASLQGGGSGDAQQLTLREFYKDQRDTYTWYFLILYFLNVVDAFVDASLYDFDVGDGLTLRLLPLQEGRVGVRMEF